MNNYYKKNINEIFTELETGLDGLTSNEAKKRLEKYGENKLKEGKKKWGRPRMSKIIKENDKNNEDIPDTEHLYRRQSGRRCAE